MQPFSVLESSIASQKEAVAVSSVMGQYAKSWCQPKTPSGFPGGLARSSAEGGVTGSHEGGTRDGSKFILDRMLKAGEAF
jgi:hypothetical protein